MENDKKKIEDDFETNIKIKKLKLNFVKINYFNDLKINFENNKNYDLEIDLKKNFKIKK
jgi:hypothetical protein